MKQTHFRWRLGPVIDNQSQTFSGHVPVRLDQLPLRQPAAIAAVSWEALEAGEARRLRELGFDEGVDVEMLHHGPFGLDPIACRVGRMTIALRRSTARAVTVRDEAPAAR